MQFSGAFWATLQRFQMSSHAIDNLLSREDTTLEDVLNDDSVITEIRSQNQKLIDFLTPSRLNQLIELVTVFPEDTENKKRCQNHPFVACEILSESGPVHDKILEDDSLLALYFSFPSSESPHSTLVGYFCKTLLAMITRSSEKTILYMRSHEVFPHLLRLLSSKGVLDVVLKVLLSENTYNAEVLEGQKDLFRGVVALLASGTQLQTVNAAAVVQDLLSKVPDFANWKDLVQLLVDPESGLKVLFEGILSPEDFRAAASGSVLRDLFNTSVKVNLAQHFTDLNLISPLVGALDQLNQKLKQNDLQDYMNTMKVNWKPLGEGRLRIAEVISSGLKQDNETLFEKIAESGVLRTVTQLFFDYPWNSIFHCVFDGIVQTTLLNQNPHIVQSLLTNPDLVQRILSTCEASEARHRPGNLGYVHKLANRLKDSNINAVKEFLASQEQWQGFADGYLSRRNTADQRQLGVISKPEPSSSSDEPEVVLPSGSDRANRFNSHETQKEESQGKDEQEVEEPDNVEDSSNPEVTAVGDEKDKEKEKGQKDETGTEPAHELAGEKTSGEPELTVETDHKESHSEPVTSGHSHSVEEAKEHAEPAEPHKTSESHHEENRPVSPLEHSPLARRRSNSGSQSPQNSGNFSHVNFWKIEILVDELDGLELD